MDRFINNVSIFSVVVLTTFLVGCPSSPIIKMPIADFIADPVSGVYPLEVSFADNSNPGCGSIQTWTWDFGDGTLSAEQNPSHLYSNMGEYSVSLTVTNLVGSDTGTRKFLIKVLSADPEGEGESIPSVPAFSADPTAGLSPLTVQFADESVVGTEEITEWLWDFGDGSTSTEQNPMHTYTLIGSHDVSLQINGQSSVSKLGHIQLIATERPTASIAVSPSMGIVPLMVQFTDDSSPGTSNITEWLWDFGDGATSSEQNPTHVFTDENIYSVVLTVTSHHGQSTTMTTITAGAQNVGFIPDPAFALAPATINFINMLSDFQPATYLWEFGDGLTSSLWEPDHTYTSAGLYTVTYTATFPFGSVSASNHVSIGEIDVDFSTSQKLGNAPLTIHFTDQTVSSSPITIWEWDFGDGETSTESNPSHIYKRMGTYSVSLTASNVHGVVTEEKADYISLTEVKISEFMASNIGGLEDEDGSSSDWIEIYNAGTEPVDLEGWTLTDDENETQKWAFPDITIDANGYILVFASGKDRTPTDGSYLHTNFKISSTGEYLAMFNNEDPPLAISEFAPEFPKQTNEYSYGIPEQEAIYEYLDTPTPMTANDQGNHYYGFAGKPEFSIERGFYDYNFSLELTSPTEGATIYYSVDGTVPTPEKGIKYVEPIEIVESIAIRATTHHEDYVPSYTETCTYILRADDFYKALPSFFIAGDPEESLFEPNGIMANVRDGEISYNNAREYGREYERPISFEYLEPVNGDWNDTTGFQINCGIRVHGSEYVRNRYRRGEDWYSCGGSYSSSKKSSFKFYFRDDYDSGLLNYPLFPVSHVTSFEDIVVRGGHNDGCNPFIRDELCRRLHVEMGAMASTGTFANLFINGVFKSYYNPCERLREYTFQQWYDSDYDWDVVSAKSDISGKPTGDIESRDGDKVVWDEMIDYARNNSLAVNMHYEKVASMLDIQDFIDYLIIQIYTANWDWPGKNWTAARERSEMGKYRFYLWDCEGTFAARRMYDTAFDNFPFSGDGLNGEEVPIPWLYRALKVNEDFRALFAQRIETHMFNGGALTDENITQRFNELADIIEPVLPNELDTSSIDEFIPQRRQIVLDAFEAEGLYTATKDQ